MSWSEITTSDDFLVTNRIMATIRLRCVRCQQCEITDLAWRVRVERNDNGDFWYIECPKREIKIINRFANAIRTGRFGGSRT